MKKLMIAACVMTAAVISQAATYNWEASNSNFHDEVSDTDVTALFYVFDANKTGTSVSDVIAALATDQWQDILGSSIALDTIDAGMVNSLSGEMDTVTGVSPDTTNNLKIYGILFDSDDLISVENYAVIPALESVPLSDSIKGGGPASFDFGDVTIGKNDWAQVAPEPTSGLLLLIGVAGLALRRRRA